MVVPPPFCLAVEPSRGAPAVEPRLGAQPCCGTSAGKVRAFAPC